jgi:predicted RNase H-like HicB family nuclease
MKRQIEIIVEKHRVEFVADPLGIVSIVVAQGNTYEEVSEEIVSAIDFHIETFGHEVIAN